MRDNFVIAYDGEKWKLRDRKETIEKLCDDKRAFESKFYDLEETLSKRTKTTFERYMNNADNDKVTKEIEGNIKRTLYNNKDMPLNMRKLLKE